MNKEFIKINIAKIFIHDILLLYFRQHWKKKYCYIWFSEVISRIAHLQYLMVISDAINLQRFTFIVSCFVVEFARRQMIRWVIMFFNSIHKREQNVCSRSWFLNELLPEWTFEKGMDDSDIVSYLQMIAM